MRVLAVLLSLTTTVAQASSFVCSGTEPTWQLQINDTQARFVFPAATQMDVKLVTPAEGRDWPQAFTLIGDRDTAIVLIEQETCGVLDHRAHVLTQRGQSPILLAGCCEATK